MYARGGEALMKGVEIENKSRRRIGGDPLGETRERRREGVILSQRGRSGEYGEGEIQHERGIG